jgi:hypothetical protein
MKWTPEHRKKIKEAIDRQTPEEKAAIAKRRSESMRATWGRRKAVADQPKASEAKAPNGAFAQKFDPGAKTLSATDCVTEASLALVKFLRVPVEQLKADLADPLQIMRLKGEAIHLANHAEEVISMIEHVKRTQEIGKAR